MKQKKRSWAERFIEWENQLIAELEQASRSSNTKKQSKATRKPTPGATRQSLLEEIEKFKARAEKVPSRMTGNGQKTWFSSTESRKQKTTSAKSEASQKLINTLESFVRQSLTVEKKNKTTVSEMVDNENAPLEGQAEYERMVFAPEENAYQKQAGAVQMEKAAARRKHMREAVIWKTILEKHPDAF